MGDRKAPTPVPPDSRKPPPPPAPPRLVGEPKSIKVGDRMRISVALLTQIYEMPNHESVIATVVDVRDDGQDGEKILVLERAP